MSTSRPDPTYPKINMDGCPATVWRHQPRQRPAGLQAREHYSQPSISGGRSVPRRPGPCGTALLATGPQRALQLWTDTEKLEVWPAQPVTLETLAALDTAVMSLGSLPSAPLQPAAEPPN